MNRYNELQPVISCFDIDAGNYEISPLGNGLINDTFLISPSSGNLSSYVLQRINHAIFQNVDGLMSNIIAVTDHIRKKLIERGESDVRRKALRFFPTKEGRYYHFDGTNYWRMMLFVPDSCTHESVTPQYAYFAGRAFGDFQEMLSDIPVRLADTIPNFHNMEFRLAQFREAVAKDAAGRLCTVMDLVEEIEKRSEAMCEGERLYRSGELPKRICHCDTKVNNILFDKDNRILCVIDLDTVMPNFIFSDFGDFMRTGANTGLEDDPNLDNVSFNMEIFKAFTKGYLETGTFLTPIEIEHLPFAAALFPYMQTVRFLTDYLNGDTYYKIKYPDHNLVRTRAQLKLVQSVESHMEEMKTYFEHDSL